MAQPSHIVATQAAVQPCAKPLAFKQTVCHNRENHNGTLDCGCIFFSSRLPTSDHGHSEEYEAYFVFLSLSEAERLPFPRQSAQIVIAKPVSLLA